MRKIVESTVVFIASFIIMAVGILCFLSLIYEALGFELHGVLVWGVGTVVTIVSLFVAAACTYVFNVVMLFRRLGIRRFYEGELSTSQRFCLRSLVYYGLLWIRMFYGSWVSITFDSVK